MRDNYRYDITFILDLYHELGMDKLAHISIISLYIAPSSALGPGSATRKL